MRLFAPIITGSLNVTGSVSITGSFQIQPSNSTANLFLIKNVNGLNILTVSQSGVIVLATQSAELTTPAPIGGIYFTSSSFFVGLS